MDEVALIRDTINHYGPVFIAPLSIQIRRAGVQKKHVTSLLLTSPRNHRFGKVRAKVEHVFRAVKCQFGYRKVRYRGIAKNGAQVFSLLALANLYLARRTFASA